MQSLATSSWKLFLLGSVFCITLAYSTEPFAWLQDLQSHSRWRQPVLLLTADGGYGVVWAEEGDRPDEWSPAPSCCFYRHVDRDGNVVVDKETLYVTPAGAAPEDYAFDSRSASWLESNSLLILGWRYGWAHWERLIRYTIGRSGRVLGKDSLAVGYGVCPGYVLVRDNKGVVYAIELGVYPNPKIMRVYPEFGESKWVRISKGKAGWRKHKSFKDVRPSMHDACVTSTSQDKLLFCYRLAPYDSREDEPPLGWFGLPNLLVYYVTDLKGDLDRQPVKIELPRDAFRKVPGIHLGGTYYDMTSESGEKVKGVENDMDLSRLPNGEMILSATGLDENAEMCVYQVKFTAQGKLVKPDTLITAQPMVSPKGRMVSVKKIVPALTYLDHIPARNKNIMRREYVLFGFDDAGHFYEDRVLWREGEE